MSGDHSRVGGSDLGIRLVPGGFACSGLSLDLALDLSDDLWLVLTDQDERCCRLNGYY